MKKLDLESCLFTVTIYVATAQYIGVKFDPMGVEASGTLRQRWMQHETDAIVIFCIGKTNVFSENK